MPDKQTGSREKPVEMPERFVTDKNLVKSDNIDPLEALNAVNKSMSESKDVDRIIEDVMDIVHSIFKCDRIWLFYPCNPDAKTFNVLSEKNDPKFPGAFSSGQELPVTPQAALTIKKALSSDDPIVFGPEPGLPLDDVAKEFGVRSQMMTAVHPHSGEPWMFGMHQCAYDRIWTANEKLLFREISYRVVEGLNRIFLFNELKKSEEKYRLLFENLYDVYFKTDDQGRIELISPSIEKITGYSPDELTGKLAVDFYIDTAQRETLQSQLIRNGHVENFEARLKKKNGEPIWVSANAKAFFDRQGNLSSLEGVFRDVTDEKQMEGSIQTLVESTAGVIGKDFFLKVASGICNWLDCDCAILGEVIDASTIQTLAVYMDGKHVPNFSYPLAGTPCEKAMDKGFCAYTEGISRLFPKDKALLDMNAVGYAGVPLVRSDSGKPLGILCALSCQEFHPPKRIKEVFKIIAARVSAEIERKKIEETRIESERKYKQLVEDIGPDSLIFIHLEDGTLTYVSPSIKDALGIEKEHVVGKRWQDAFNWVPGSLARANTEVQELINGKENCSYEVSYYDDDDELRTIHVQSHLVPGPKCGPRQIEGLATDITAKKKTESEKEDLIQELKKALDNVKTLSGLLPICSKCKKIRDDKGYWNNLESYIQAHSDASFSHGMCLECSDELYGKEDWYRKMKNKKGLT